SRLFRRRQKGREGMSKERLEEIRHYYREMESFDPGTQSDINWLIEQAERVQELERVNKQLKGNLSVYKGYYKNTLKINEDVVEENKKYREGLEFYAKKKHYKVDAFSYNVKLIDDGEIAREKLEESK